MGGLTEREQRMVVVRAGSFTVKELCKAEKVATCAREWWLAEQIRWAIAHKCIEGGGEDGNEI